MKKRTLFLVALLVLGTLVLTACAGTSTNPPAGNDNSTTTTAAGTPVGNDANATLAPYVTTSPNAVLLTESDAEEIALTHAGVDASRVTMLRTEYEIDDGVAYYEVSFRENTTEYDYDIHAESGAILDVDIDYEGTRTTAATNNAAITAEEAQAKALAHAGLEADAVTRLRSEYDVDDGRAHYDVSFYNGSYEYDYEIDATTGDVISYDKDRED